MRYRARRPLKAHVHVNIIEVLYTEAIPGRRSKDPPASVAFTTIRDSPAPTAGLGFKSDSIATRCDNAPPNQSGTRRNRKV